MLKIANTKPWQSMSLDEKKAAALQIDTQLKAIANQMAFDVNGEMVRLGMPVTFTAVFQMNWDRGLNPNNDA